MRDVQNAVGQKRSVSCRCRVIDRPWNSLKTIELSEESNVRYKNTGEKTVREKKTALECKM